MKFLMEVRCSDALRKRDVISDLKTGLHYHVGSGDPEDSYLKLLDQVKLVEVKKFKVKKIGRTR